MDKKTTDTDSTYDLTDHTSSGDESKSLQNQSSLESHQSNQPKSDIMDIQPSPNHASQSRPSLCGNLNCPNCCASSLASSINMDCFYAQSLPAHHYFNRSRICSSNDSSQLDDSYDYSRCASPPLQQMPHLLGRQRARSLSCSPSKMHNESDIVVLQNEKFKEKFPNACQQMEERLEKFIDSNLDFRTQIDLCQPDPAAR